MLGVVDAGSDAAVRVRQACALGNQPDEDKEDDPKKVLSESSAVLPRRMSQVLHVLTVGKTNIC
jgi:hypothetical protein